MVYEFFWYVGVIFCKGKLVRLGWLEMVCIVEGVGVVLLFCVERVGCCRIDEFCLFIEVCWVEKGREIWLGWF